jgi:hypothetical protein
MADMYVRLSYDEYKDFERQMEAFKELETTHTTMGDRRFYHKAFRFKLPITSFEVHGPSVSE